MEIIIYIVSPLPLERKRNMIRGKVSSKKISYKIFARCIILFLLHGNMNCIDLLLIEYQSCLYIFIYIQ